MFFNLRAAMLRFFGYLCTRKTMNSEKPPSLLVPVLTGLLTVVMAIAVNFATSSVPPEVINNSAVSFCAWSLVAVGAVLTIYFSVKQYTHTRSTLGSPPIGWQSVTGSQDQDQLRVLRQRVKRYWIEGVLEHSLEHEAAIRLEIADSSTMIEDRPWKAIPQELIALPPGASIMDAFNLMDQRMLILGEPGSGKTTALLELARELIRRADETPALPSPVVLNLSSWIERKAPLSDWLVDELSTRYTIPKRLGQVWIAQDKLFLFLDGLDEVQSQHREDCIKAINHFLQEHLAPVAICSRLAEYEGLGLRLRLHGAVLIQPLTSEQVIRYLHHAGPMLAAVRSTLQEDKELSELAKSPLMLSIMVLAYQGVSPADLVLSDTASSRRKHLFDTYIRRMLVRREAEAVHTSHETLSWLHWLSVHLMQYGQTVFLIEQMQPSWMQSDDAHQYPTFLMWLTGPLYGLFFGPVFGLLVALINRVWVGLFTGLGVGLSIGQSAGLSAGVGAGLSAGLGAALDAGLGIRLVDWLTAGLIAGLAVGLVIGLVYGLADGVTGGFKRISPLEQPSALTKRLRSSLLALLFWGVLGGLTYWLIDRLNGELFHSMPYALVYALIYGLTGGMIGGFREIQLVRRPYWSKHRLKNNTYFALSFGLSVGMIGGLFFWLIVERVLGLEGAVSALIEGPVLGLVGGLFFALVFQPSTGISLQDTRETEIPNQGIRLSAQYAAETIRSFMWNGVFIGLCCGALILGVVTWRFSALIYWLLAVPYDGLAFIIADGVFSGHRVELVGPLVGLYGGLIGALLMMLTYGLKYLLITALNFVLILGSFGGLIGGTIGGLIGGGDVVVKHYLLRLRLWKKDHMPWDYARFLDYATSLIFLRKVGGGYMFVHRLVMEHFASLTKADIERITASLDSRF